MTTTKLNPNQTNDYILSNSLFRQLLRNSNMDIWQRGVSITANSTLSADGWRHYFTGTSITITQDTDVPDTLSKYSLKGVYITGGTNKDIYHFQRIEGIDASKFSGKKITYSFWIKASAAAGTINVAQVYFEYPSALDNWGAFENATGSSYSFTPTDSWTKVTGTVTLPATSSSGYSIANGLSFNINLRASDNTTLTYNIAQVQLCAGDVALPFMPKSYEEELRACMRYCIAYTSSNVAARFGGVGFAVDTTHAYIPFIFPVPMRTVPTLTTTATDWKVTDDTTSTDLTAMAILNNINSNMDIHVYCTVASGLTQFRPYVLEADGNANRLLYFSAEL